MRNQKGFTGIEIAGIVALGFIVIGAVAPLIGIRLPGMPGGAGQTSTQKSSYKETVEPVLTKDGQPMLVATQDGQEAYLFKRVKSNDASDEKVIPPAPLVERVLMWFVHLGFAGLLLALAFPAFAIGLWRFIVNRWNKLKATAVAEQIAHAVTMEEAKKIVLSVQAGLQVFEQQLKAAENAVETATQASAGVTDPATVASYQQIIQVQGAVARALNAAKKSFKNTMAVNQDKSTMLLVEKLKA